MAYQKTKFRKEDPDGFIPAAASFEHIPFEKSHCLTPTYRSHGSHSNSRLQ